MDTDSKVVKVGGREGGKTGEPGDIRNSVNNFKKEWESRKCFPKKRN